MFPAKFDYFRPTSVDEAVQLLRQNPNAKILAGGHSLLPAMKLRLAQPPALLDIGRISGLSGVSHENGRLRIGALTTHAEVMASATAQEYCPLLPEAAAWIGDRQVRHRGTVGGNLAHADPASDLPAVILALNATLHTASANGTRQINASDFFIDLLTTAMQPDEILTHIVVDILGSGTGSAYVKFEHPASGYAVCGAAAVVTFNIGHVVDTVRLCFNGVAAIPVDAIDVANALTGEELSDSDIERAIDSRLSIYEPISDSYASGQFRTELAKSLGKQALKLARDRIGQQ
jgi:aerobic carbon-monoxide dehydrogenase medium subunit